MKPLKVKDWFIFGEWYGIFWFHACYFEGLVKTIRDRLGYGLSQAVIEQAKDVQRIYLSRSEWTKIGEEYLKEVIKSPIKLERILSQVRRAADDLILFSFRLKKLRVDKLTKNQRSQWLKKYHDTHHQLWTIGQVTNVLELENYFLADYLKSFLASKKLDPTDHINFFQTLSMPAELSMAQKEEREMLKLAWQKDPGVKLLKHWQRYSWLNFGWTGPSLKLEYFAGRHRGLYKEGKAKDRLKEILGEDKKLIADKRLIIKRLKISSEMKKLFRLFEELLFIKAHRMDALFMSYEAVQPLLKSIAKDYNLSLQQIYSLDMQWLYRMIGKNLVDANKVNEIAKYSLQYFDGQKTYLLMGREAEKIAAQVKKNLPKIVNQLELKGETAFPGKAKGRVKIINLASEMDKFLEGDILVSNVTDPSLLPVMKKAAAFVTNMGGLTAHAAIVARELKTPCVVGTKIATRVLEDGDLVEVDATKGIVKKL